MYRNGYSTVETALTFPIFILLTVVLIFVLIMSVKPDTVDSKTRTEYIERVQKTDSIRRKADIINVLFE